MAPESDGPGLPDELSPEEAGRCLIRLLGKQDLDEHAEIYEELAYE